MAEEDVKLQIDDCNIGGLNILAIDDCTSWHIYNRKSKVPHIDYLANQRSHNIKGHGISVITNSVI